MDQGLNKQLDKSGMSCFGAAVFILLGCGKTVALQLGHKGSDDIVAQEGLLARKVGSGVSDAALCWFMSIRLALGKG